MFFFSQALKVNATDIMEDKLSTYNKVKSKLQTTNSWGQNQFLIMYSCIFMILKILMDTK